MPTAAQIDILIDIRSRLDQLGQATSEIARLKKETSGLAQSFSIGFGAGFATQIVAGISQIGSAMQNAIGSGIQFSATLEGAQLGIAAVLKQFDNVGRFKTFDEAMQDSGNAINLLKQKALESPASFESLVQAFQATAGAATSAGIPVKKQIDLLVNLSQALAGLGIRNEQIVQETRALLTGNITEDALAARILGITGSQVNQAKESGQLFEFLSGKISSFAEAGKKGSESYTTSLSNLGDAVQQAQAEITQPIFDELKKSFLEITKVVSTPEFKDSFKAIAREIASFVEIATKAIKVALEYSGVLISLAKSATLLGISFAVVKAAQAAGNLVQNISQLIAFKTATEAVTAATSGNTAATQANTVAKAQNSLAGVAAIRDRLKSAETGVVASSASKIAQGFQGAVQAVGNFGSKLVGTIGSLNLILIASQLVAGAVNIWVDKLNSSNDAFFSLNDRFNEQIRGTNEQIKGLDSVSKKESLINDLIKSRESLQSEVQSKKGEELKQYELQIRWIDLSIQRLAKVGDEQIRINAEKAEELRTREKQAQLDSREAADFESSAKKARVTEKQISFDTLPNDSARIESLKSDRQKIFNKASTDSQTSIDSTQELRTQFLVEDTKATSGGSDAIKAKAKRRADDLQVVFEIEKQIADLEKNRIRDADLLEKKEKDRKELILEIAALEKEISGDKNGANNLRLNSIRDKSFNQFKEAGLSDAQANQGADLERQKQSLVFQKQKEDDQSQQDRTRIQRQADEAADKALSLRAQGQIDRAQAEEEYQQVLIETLRLMEREKISLDEAQIKAKEFIADKNTLANQDRDRILRETQAQNKIAQVQSERSLINSNRGLSPEAKNRALLISLAEEQKVLLETIRLWKERRATIEGNSPEAVTTRDEISSRINQSEGKVSEISAQQDSLADQEQFTDGLLSKFENLGTIAQQTGRIISETMGSAVNGVASSIASAIVRGEDWRSSMQNVSLSIIESLIQMSIQMILMNTLGRTLQAATATQAAATGPTIATAYAPAAAATSVASFGSSAIVGVIAATVAIAAIIALLAGGFNQGGIIPGAASNRDNRIAMVATGEYVARSAAVSYYGPETFEALNQMRLPKNFLGGIKVPVSARPSVGFASGGLVAPLAAAQSDQNNKSQDVRVAFTNSRQDTRDFIRGEGRGMIVDIASRQSGEIV